MTRYLTQFFIAVCLVVFEPALLFGQAPPSTDEVADLEQTYVINVRAVALADFTEQVADMTGRTLILDPSVRGEVTVVSAEPLPVDGVWALYQTVLRVNGFAAVRAGAGWRIAPINEAAQDATFSRGGSPGQDLVTRLIPLRNMPASQAASAVASLSAGFGDMQAVERPNALIVTDTADTVARITELAETLDSVDAAQTEIIPLRFAEAGEVANSIEALLGSHSQRAGQIAIADDARSNALLVRAGRSDLLEIRRLAAELDQPGAAAPSLRVHRLRHTDAEVVAGILQAVLTGQGGPVTNPVARALGRSSQSSQGGPSDIARRVLGDQAPAVRDAAQPTGLQSPIPSGRASGSEGPVIYPASQMNAIVVRAGAASHGEIEALIGELDRRRPQVLIEAAIVEVTGERAEQLGVQLGFDGAALDQGVAATSFSLTGPSLRSLLATLGVPGAVGLNESGATFGISGDDFSILIQALGQATSANLLSTPSVTTLDNQLAEIVVGQNVPFRTGSFATDGNSVTPFTTIERQDVGITLRVAPRIHDGDVVRLDVSQEVSSLVNANLAGAADLITNRRSIQTTVLADDGETIVLGGLITDDALTTRSEVPGLGRVPGVGRLFRSEQETATKRTLFVFLRPTVLRSGAASEAITDERLARMQALRGAVEPASLLFSSDDNAIALDIEGLY
mgnify:CR=1 FL=1